MDELGAEARGPPQERGLGRSPHLPPSNAGYVLLVLTLYGVNTLFYVFTYFKTQLVPRSKRLPARL
jgi:hypothetical protein